MILKKKKLFENIVLSVFAILSSNFFNRYAKTKTYSQLAIDQSPTGKPFFMLSLQHVESECAAWDGVAAVE